MNNITEELKAEVERVTLRGSPDKRTVQKLASIIWRLDQRVQELEEAAMPTNVEVELEEKKPARKTTRKTTKTDNEE